MVNKVILLGNVGADPDVKTFDNGGKIVEVRMATNERYKDRNGEKQERTEWHTLIIGGKQADIAEKYITKGSKLFVEGKISTRSYEDKDNNTRYVTEIRVLNFQMFGGSGTSSGDSVKNKPAKNSKPATAPAEDDDLPF